MIKVMSDLDGSSGFKCSNQRYCVRSTVRIDAALPTRKMLAQGARVAVMSHLGRPEEGACEPEFSLAPVAESLSEKLGREVP